MLGVSVLLKARTAFDEAARLGVCVTSKPRRREVATLDASDRSIPVTNDAVTLEPAVLSRVLAAPNVAVTLGDWVNRKSGEPNEAVTLGVSVLPKALAPTEVAATPGVSDLLKIEAAPEVAATPPA